MQWTLDPCSVFEQQVLPLGNVDMNISNSFQQLTRQNELALFNMLSQALPGGVIIPTTNKIKINVTPVPRRPSCLAHSDDPLQYNTPCLPPACFSSYSPYFQLYIMLHGYRNLPVLHT